MKTLFVTPKTGVVVRREDTLKPLSEQGETVPDCSYYRRRIADGDLVKGTEPAPKSTGKKGDKA
jgi:hypothetical protein